MIVDYSSAESVKQNDGQRADQKEGNNRLFRFLFSFVMIFAFIVWMLQVSDGFVSKEERDRRLGRKRLIWFLCAFVLIFAFAVWLR